VLSSVTGIEATLITRAHAARDVLIQVIGRVGNLLLGIVVVITITRKLGVDGTGEWSTLLAISTLTAYLVEPGLQPTALRMAAADPDREAHWLGTLVMLRLLTGIIGAVVCFAASVAVASGPSMVIAGALISATALTSPAQSLAVVFQLRVRNDRTIAFMTLNSILWTGSVVLIAVLGGGLVAFAAAFLVTSVITVLAQGAYVWRSTPVALNGLRRHGRQLLRIGLVLGLASALTIAYGKIDQILVLHYQGTRGAGLYAAAYSFLDRVQFLPLVLMTTVFPIVSAAWPADPERARRAIQRTLGYMAIVSFPALAIAIAAARPLLVLLFGVQFAPASGALVILMAAFIPTCFGYVVGSLAVVVNRQRIFVCIALGGLVFNIVGNVLLLPRYGFIAAAWMTLATELLVIIPAAITTLRGFGVAPDLRRFPRAAAAAAIVGVIVWLAHRAGAGIVLLGLVAGIVYPFVVLATGTLTPEDRAELDSRVRQRMPENLKPMFTLRRTAPRPRHAVSPRLLFTLQPLFRYSLMRDAWILRGVGESFGPVLRTTPGAPAAPGAHWRREARSRPIGVRRRSVVLLLGGIVVVAALGFTIARGLGGRPTPPALDRHARAGLLAVRFPSDWRRRPPRSARPLRLTDQIALAPATGGGLLGIGRLDTADHDLLPASSIASFARAPRPQIVRLGHVSFYRFQNPSPPEKHGSESLYLVPTTVGTVVGVCRIPARTADVAGGCQRTLGSLRLASGRFLPLGPNRTYVADLNSVIGHLNAVRVSAGAQLSTAPDAAAQATAADALAATYATAASQLTSVDAGSAALANAAVAIALGQTAAAYTALSGAAARDDVTGYRNASASITHATNAVNSALAQLSALGYRVS
jgi:O-antigen/teichoic acid export membrane protein